ncbi:MAG: carboxypeptidase regulatory-like domain-containing protein [Verrucomicrobia bacterium]|nr:carboxypeptidase regulatory-like domain-containing protein [Verrucomicrobiota bacterium]
MKHKIIFCLALGLLFSFSLLAHSETLNVSRRLVRFDGEPAAGAKVRVLGDYGSGNEKTDFEVIANAGGIFSADVTQEDKQWVGHLIVRAEGCAMMCEVGVTGHPKSAPRTPVRRLGRPFNIEGRTTDAKGRPVADAKVSLVLAQLQSYNETPFNSTKTHLTKTPELIAHSTANGVWSMMGIDFVLQDHSVPATAVFEAVADNPLRASKLNIKLDPDPGAESRKNVPLDFRLAPLIRVAGRVVNSVNGEPVAGVHCVRSEIFTSLTGSSALTDEAGRFELEIPGPLRILGFYVYRDGFATTTLKTATREQATSDWGDTNDLLITVRPMVSVSGTLLDANGKPPDEPVELAANYNDKINAIWDQECGGVGSESKVGADGSFNAKLPAGHITVVLLAPPQQMGSVWGVGATPKNYRLQQQVDIPAKGMTGLQLKTSRRGP